MPEMNNSWFVAYSGLFQIVAPETIRASPAAGSCTYGRFFAQDLEMGWAIR